MMLFNIVFIILAATSVVGAVAIPLGDPQFVDRAIALELSFVALAVLAYKGFRKALYACVPISILVMVGNSLAPPHVEIMTTFSKPLNAVLLIFGGYVLQGALIASTIYELTRHQRRGIIRQEKS
ncbi:MAG: hypothetical protein ACREAQ_05255 [Nitrososphaera sp.]